MSELCQYRAEIITRDHSRSISVLGMMPSSFSASSRVGAHSPFLPVLGLEPNSVSSRVCVCLCTSPSPRFCVLASHISFTHSLTGSTGSVPSLMRGFNRCGFSTALTHTDFQPFHSATSILWIVLMLVGRIDLALLLRAYFVHLGEYVPLQIHRMSCERFVR